VSTTTTPDQGVAELQGGVGLPAWPVLVLLWGFPLWWITGTTVLFAGVLTIVMAAYLIIGRTLAVLPGMAALAGFVLWVLASVTMIDSGERLLGYAYRTVIIVFVVTAFVYTTRSAGQLTRGRIIDALTFVWFFTIVAGLVAMIIPEVRLTTPMGLLLPDAVRSNDYVQDLFFPPMAEIQHPYGSPQTFVRPSAPFPYANSWGVAIVLLSPVAVAFFLKTRSVLMRVLVLVAFAAMIPPAIATGNRGMFAALGLSGVYVVVRMAVRDRAGPVISLGLLGLAGLGTLVASGLLERIAVRQEYGDSLGTRSSLYGETLQRVLESPLLGYGAPRPSAQPDISLGTQGYVWMLLFSYGFVGLALFMAFLWGTTARTWRASGDIDLVLHSMLVAASVVVFVYGLDIMQLLTVVLVAAVLVRRRHGLEPDPPARDDTAGAGATTARV
jgi:hypothetical protein